MRLILDILLAIVLIGSFRLLGVLWVLCLIAAVSQAFAGNALTTILLLWVAFAGVKDE